MKIHDLMTTGVRTVKPESTLITAAQVMRESDIGSLPICDGETIVGLLTDRDIVIKAVAKGMNLEQALVQDILTGEVLWVYEDETIEEAASLMEEKDVRRLIVVNENKKLVGMISLGDIANYKDSRLSGEVLKDLTQSLSGPSKNNTKENH